MTAVVAFLGTQALGNFIIYHLVAASVARAIEGGRLAVIFRDDRPYKGLVSLMSPSVAATLRLPADAGYVLPLDWFDGREDVPGRPFDAAWYAQGFHRPDLFLTPSMLDPGRVVGMPPAFRFPDLLAPPVAAALEAAGVDRDRWFACVHMREEGYPYRRGADPDRNVDPMSYLAMIDDIVDSLGGQVVRLGDPAMTPLSPRPGLIDLGRDAEGFALQAFALSRARFFIGTDSGPTQLAGALKVPAATTNAMGIGVWNESDIVLFKHAFAPDGRRIELGELLAIGGATIHWQRPAGITYRDNRPDELIAASRALYDRTGDCPGWRATAPEMPPAAASRALTLPLWRRDASEVARLVFPD